MSTRARPGVEAGAPSKAGAGSKLNASIAPTTDDPGQRRIATRRRWAAALLHRCHPPDGDGFR